MTTSGLHRPTPLIKMADGTIKQINPFTGTEVWSVPGRGNRPLSKPAPNPQPLEHTAVEDYCAFCEADQLKTPPEKSRMVWDGEQWQILRGLVPEELDQSRPAFRRVPNLFEIVSYSYWQLNYGFSMDGYTRHRMDTYLAAPGGREHVAEIVDKRLRAAGRAPDMVAPEERAVLAESYFGGCHDVLVARRHFVDGATHDDQLAASGTLTVDEHRAFIHLTVDTARDLHERNQYTRYVSIFQNWLSPAGASFEHLHKQLVAIDTRGVQAEEEIMRLRQNPNMYNEWGVNYAAYHNLVVAQNDHAVIIVGIGHRYPTLGIYSTSPNLRPWSHTVEEINGMSDLIHAAHAATGAEVATNEEWHYQPVDLDLPMPWRVNIKWRVSTLAGFEGGTKIYVNTLSPEDTRDRVCAALYQLREHGLIDDKIRIAAECDITPNRLRYNPLLG